MGTAEQIASMEQMVKQMNGNGRTYSYNIENNRATTWMETSTGRMVRVLHYYWLGTTKCWRIKQ